MRLALRIGMILLISAYLVLVLGFVDRQSGAVLCEGMEVIVRDSLARKLVSSADVKNMVRLEHQELAGRPLPDIDLAGIEESLKGFPAIKEVQVYSNVQGKIIIELSQRIPILRIEDSRHQHYFLDKEGYVIPANLDNAPHLLYVNGAIPREYRKAACVAGLDQLPEDILKIGTYIHKDPFWKAQIVQLYVKGNGEFELIPRVGSHIIQLGDAGDMQKKFFKLRTLYEQGFRHTGWNQYEIINLKYSNQVICTKR